MPPVANIWNPRPVKGASSSCCAELDQDVLDRAGPHDALESAIANYELAARMQTAVPELTELSGETPATQHAVRPRLRLRADPTCSATSA